MLLVEGSRHILKCVNLVFSGNETQTSIWVRAPENVFSCDKHEKSIIYQSFGMSSTRMLVEIYNTQK